MARYTEDNLRGGLREQGTRKPPRIPTPPLPREIDCWSNADCPPGYECKAGKCVKIIVPPPPHKKTLACLGGICKEVDFSTPELIAACRGKAVGDPCGTAQGCKADADCPPGWKCINGKCQEFVPPKDIPGCTDPKATNYNPKANHDDGSCKYEGEDGGVGGEYKWSPEIQALLARILERANMLLDQPLGLSDEERQAIYNRIFEKIKGAERPAIQSQMDIASRQGLLGSPYAERAITGIQRGTRETLAGAERDIEIEEAQNRFNQLMQTTAMSQSLLGTGMNAEQIAEALSGARRGEGTGVLAMLLQYLATMGGQNSYYWQAIMNKLLQQGA